jgi:hypothetical protein
MCAFTTQPPTMALSKLDVSKHNQATPHKSSFCSTAEHNTRFLLLLLLLFSAGPLSRSCPQTDDRWIVA